VVDVFGAGAGGTATDSNADVVGISRSGSRSVALQDVLCDSSGACTWETDVASSGSGKEVGGGAAEPA
jgi:hypothetical protein